MQTFVPSADLRESVRVLDQKRLGKQRVESLQILQALSQARLVSARTEIYVPSRGKNAGRPTKRSVPLPREQWQVFNTKVGWDSHKVTNMWRGSELALLIYQLFTCEEWVNRGYKDTCWEKSKIIYEHTLHRDGDWSPADNFEYIIKEVGLGGMSVNWPNWLGDERVHSSHRAALKFKAPEFYDQYGWEERPVYNYHWPPESEIGPVR